MNLDLLPADPVGFFELGDPYDRRDLKRAYGRAIRVYKPETHPAEFQLIRDAYERLEKLLRYGKQQKQLEEATSAWSAATGKVEAAETQAAAGAVDPDRLVARSVGGATTEQREESRAESRTISLRQLAVIDPGAALEHIESKTKRTPPDYYLAAVLSDAVAGKPTGKYLGRLIDGLVAYPNDPGLTVLATEFARTEVPDDSAVKVVRFIASRIRLPLFYMLTESLWLRMTDTMPFDQWQPLLADCERQLHQTEPATRAAFYLRLLRAAIWTAPPQWSGEVIQDLEARSAELGPAAQNDLEFLSEIHEMLQAGGQNVDNPIRQKLLDTVRLACRAEEGTATATIIEALHEIARDASGVQQAFPLETAEDDGTWVSLAYTLVHQVQEYLEEPVRMSNERVVTQLLHMISDLEPTEKEITGAYASAQTYYKTLPLLAWTIGGTVFGGMPIVVVSVIAGGSSGGLIAMAGLILWFIALLAAFYRWLYPRYLRPKREAKQQQWAMEKYAKHWRNRIFRFAGSTNEPLETQLALIEAVCSRSGKHDLGYSLIRCIQSDPGLCIFAGLQSVLR